MKKYFIYPSLIVFLAFMFLLSCNNNTPTTTSNPVASPAVTPVITPSPVSCTPGNVNYSLIYSGINYNIGMTPTGVGSTNTAVSVINSQAQYILLYQSSSGTPGAPTPTPVPIDFTTKTLVGLQEYINCNYGETLTASTDCSTISFNWQLTPSSGFCGGIKCNAVGYTYMYYLINKTYLQVESQYTFLACP